MIVTLTNKASGEPGPAQPDADSYCSPCLAKAPLRPRLTG